MTITLDGTKGTTTPGLYSSTTFTGTYADGIVVDYTSTLGRISVGTSDGLAFYNGGVATTELMRIDSSGNVGIGAIPSSSWNSGYKALQIANAGYGSLSGQIGGASTMQLSWGAYATGVDTWAYLTTGDTVCQYLMNSGLHRWRTAASGTAGNAITWNDAMRIDSSGNLLVGTATASGKTRIFQSANDIALRLDVGNTGFTNQIIYVTCTTAEGTGYSVMTYRNENAARDDFIIFGNGNVQNRNNSYAGISDIKLKENIVDATPKLADLMQVKVRTYNLIGDTQKQIGVVAQELEQVFPAMVEESPDREMRKTVDADGNETESMIDLGTTTKSVKYSVFVPMLIKAIQEQQAIIQQLQADMAQLKGQA